MKINKSTAFTLKNIKKKEPPKPFGLSGLKRIYIEIVIKSN